MSRKGREWAVAAVVGAVRRGGRNHTSWVGAGAERGCGRWVGLRGSSLSSQNTVTQFACSRERGRSHSLPLSPCVPALLVVLETPWSSCGRLGFMGVAGRGWDAA